MTKQDERESSIKEAFGYIDEIAKMRIETRRYQAVAFLICGLAICINGANLGFYKLVIPELSFVIALFGITVSFVGGVMLYVNNRNYYYHINK